MRQLNYAKEVILSSSLVRDGKIKVFPQSIINNLEEFNEKYNTDFTYESFSNDIVEYLRKTYNNFTNFDYSNLKCKSKDKFNEIYLPYAYVVDRR